MRNAIVLLSVFLMLISGAMSATIRVPTDQGTIQAAINASVDDDTVLVAPGQYGGALNYFGKSIVLISEGGPEVTSIFGTASGPLVYMTKSGGTATFEGFTLRGASGLYGLLTQPAGDAIIRNNRFTQNSLSNSDLGVLQVACDAEISDNVIFTNFGHGILVTGNSAQIFNNTVHQNRYGITERDDGTIFAFDNIVSNNSIYGIDATVTEHDYNCQWSNGDPAVMEQHGLELDPMYADPSNSDYALQLNSPCIDAGRSADQYNDPDGTRADMGAALPLTEINTVVALRVADRSKWNVTDHSPEIQWAYYNMALPQTAYELEVFDPVAPGTVYWATGQAFTTDTSVIYLGTTLEDGLTYGIRIKIYNGVSWTDWFETTFRMNTPPSKPIPTGPAGPTNVNGAVRLAVSAATDNDNDALDYEFELYSDSSLNSLLWSGWVFEPTGQVQSPYIGGLVEGESYVWRSRATDRFELSQWSALTHFTIDSLSGEDMPMFVALEQVTGLLPTGNLPVDDTVEFLFRISNFSSHTIEGSANGFNIYSPDGATWRPAIQVDTNLLCDPGPCTIFDTTWYGEFIDPVALAPLTWVGSSPAIYDGGIFVNTYSTDGQGADTVGFAGFNQEQGWGLIPGFDEIGWKITISGIDDSSAGKTLCLDSSYYPPSGRWLWANSDLWRPNWNGPFCWMIGDCCVGVRGNIAYEDPGINIVDLTALVKYMFGGTGGTLTYSCPLAANVNGDIDESVDIADLTFMVNYMFKGGPAPAACP